MLVTQLPEVEKLPWGQELKAAWTAEGRVNELREQATQYDDLHAAGDLTDAVHARLKSALAQQLAQLEAELLRLQRTPRNSALQ